jgi:hypothetical protein
MEVSCDSTAENLYGKELLLLLQYAHPDTSNIGRTVSRKFYQVPAPSTRLLTRLHFGQLWDHLRLCHAVGIVKS